MKSRGLALWIEDTEQLEPQGGLNVQRVFVQPFLVGEKTEYTKNVAWIQYFCIYLYVRDIGTASKLEIFLLFTSFTASPRGLEWNSQVATSASSVLTDVFDTLTALCEQQLQGITWHCKRKIAVNKYLESHVFIIHLPFLISFILKWNTWRYLTSIHWTSIFTWSCHVIFAGKSNRVFHHSDWNESVTVWKSGT